MTKKNAIKNTILCLLIFITGLICGRFINIIGVYTTKITTEEEFEDKNIVEIVREEKSCIVGIESISPKGEITASGIIFNEGGYIVTNAHIVEEANEIVVYFNDGTKEKAIRVAQDSLKDLAILKVEERGLPVATFGNSDNCEVGEVAIAIGNPLGNQLTGTVTVGVISALHRQLEINERVMNLIQSDAAINAGNSGGALLNIKGEVIGMNTFYIPADKATGIGFAIPSNEIVRTIQQLIKE